MIHQILTTYHNWVTNMASVYEMSKADPTVYFLDPFLASQIHKSIKLHFSDSNTTYDAVKYNFKTKVAAGAEFKFANSPEAYWYNVVGQEFTRNDFIKLIAGAWECSVSGENKLAKSVYSGSATKDQINDFCRRYDTRSDEPMMFEEFKDFCKGIFIQQDRSLADSLTATNGIIPLLRDIQVDIANLHLLNLSTGFLAKGELKAKIDGVEKEPFWKQAESNFNKYHKFFMKEYLKPEGVYHTQAQVIKEQEARARLVQDCKQFILENVKVN